MGKKSGMTIIELTVVLLIIGFINLSFIIGSSWLNRVKLESKAREIISAIEYAKQASLLTGVSHSLQIKENTFRVYQNGISKKLIYKIELEPNQSLVNESNAKREILINSNGTVNQALTLNLRHKDSHQNIKITIGVATSKIRWYKGEKAI